MCQKAGFFQSSQKHIQANKKHTEGMYYDETPKNCPPTMITQCQQWGFQRLVPCFDDMTAKCTYKTTITADSRYTNIITNGDVIEPRRNIGMEETELLIEIIFRCRLTYSFLESAHTRLSRGNLNI
jgi:aminopeptidase N